jgi:hypothetical protein
MLNKTSNQKKSAPKSLSIGHERPSNAYRRDGKWFCLNPVSGKEEPLVLDRLVIAGR